jgi:hypothetical protein
MIMNDELERTCKEVVTEYFKVPSQHFPGGTGTNHEKPQSGELISGSRNKLETSQM